MSEQKFWFVTYQITSFGKTILKNARLNYKGAEFPLSKAGCELAEYINDLSSKFNAIVSWREITEKQFCDFEGTDAVGAKGILW